MKEELIQKAYEVAKERYAAIGVDVEKAMDALQKISLSLPRAPLSYISWGVCSIKGKYTQTV